LKITFVRSLNEKHKEIGVNMTRNMVQPMNILMTLKDKIKDNVIYKEILQHMSKVQKVHKN